MLSQQGCRKGLKDRSARENDQRRRRIEKLSQQRLRRAEVTAACRTESIPTPGDSKMHDASISHISSTSRVTDGPETQEVPSHEVEHGCPAMETEPKKTTDNRKGTAEQQKAAGAVIQKLMTAEWMVDIPEDLPTAWYVMPKPAGKRCLVSTEGGETIARSRGGRPWRFPSSLPGGRRSGRSSAGRCQLDCIWLEAQQTYFVLDLLCWKEYHLVDCPAEFRYFWLRSKLEEVRAGEQCSTNPCRFVAPSYAPCTANNLQLAYTADTGYERDGLLFCHSEALYEPGPNPLLLLWSDSNCSSRFFDYGSEQMASAVQQEPAKAERWRTMETEAALPFSALMDAVQGSMDAME
mmetsp:Transcript_5171/g.9994  ORF Transcript_5171/g.9994 Transcript_5171/m.9994 type:complete len:350 (-) Transcript_5171:158-1207(-)